MKSLGVYPIVLILIISPIFINPGEVNNDIDNSIINDSTDIELKNSIGNYFTLNEGQISDPDVIFHTESAHFTSSGVRFRVFEQRQEQTYDMLTPFQHNREPMNFHIYKMNFIGANYAGPIGQDKLPHNSNFFLGDDSSKWATDVPNYREIIYENLYNNIDLIYRMVPEGIKYDFVIHPGGDVRDIQMEYNGAGIYTDGSNLFIETSVGTIKDGGLFAYQIKDQKQKKVFAEILIDKNTVSFNVDYNPDYKLVIDPLIYSTFLGGTQSDVCKTFTLDKQADMYTAGYTVSSDFPTTVGAYDRNYNSAFNADDVFISKLSNNGSKLVYSTYVGGSYDDNCDSIAVDSAGNLYATGQTRSYNFPTPPDFYDDTLNQPSPSVYPWDVFVLKLNSTGSDLLYSTYVGGTKDDYGYAITVDSSGCAYVTGQSRGLFPITPDANYSKHEGNGDCFVFKLNATCTGLLYSTYIKVGSGYEYGVGIEIDSLGNAYVTGHAHSADYNGTPGASDETYNGGNDVMVFKLNHNGSSLIYLTYLGSPDDDWPWDIDIDSSCNVYVTGITFSTEFPTTSDAYDKIYNDGNKTSSIPGERDGDAILAKISSDGSSLLYSTYIGGGMHDMGKEIAATDQGYVYLSGYTYSEDFPITSSAMMKNINNGSISTYTDVFVMKFDISTSHVSYSTFLGGSSGEMPGGIEVDYNKIIYIGGSTGSTDFPVTSDALYTSHSGGNDAFITKFDIPASFRITSLSLLKDNTTVDIAYSKLDNYKLRVGIINTKSINDLTSVELNIDPSGTNIKLNWDRATDIFSKSGDPFNYISLKPSSSANTNYVNSWTIEFHVIFNWNFPDDNLYSVSVNAKSSSNPDAWLNKTDLFRIENDLEFYGYLTVKGEDQRIIDNGDPVGCTEKLYWEGLTPVYEGTIDVFPPESEFDITIWDDEGNYWLDSPDAGEIFYITTTSPESAYPSFSYRVNLGGIPPENDKTNVTFTVEVKKFNIMFTDPKPAENKWNTVTDITVGITIEVEGGSSINASSVEYTQSVDEGDSWSNWNRVPGLTSSKTVKPAVHMSLKEGTHQRIKWKAGDSKSNNIVESKPFAVLVDTKPVEFKDPYPSSKDVLKKEEATVSIIISDETSGVNASTIEYSISTDRGNHWSPWQLVSGFNNSNMINASVDLVLPNGTGNMVKWRAKDIAGNSKKSPVHYPIYINTWVETPKIYTRLLSPENEVYLPTSDVTLTWMLEESEFEIEDLSYDVYFGKVNPPNLYIGGLKDTELYIDNLTYNMKYYWTVLPRGDGVESQCKDNVWRFTAGGIPPEGKRRYDIDLSGSNNISLLPGEMVEINITISNLGTEDDAILLEIDFGTLKSTYVTFDISSFALDHRTSSVRTLKVSLPSTAKAGTYTITIKAISANGSEEAGDTHTLLVVIKEKDISEIDDAQEKSDAGALIILFAVLMAVVVVIVYFIMIRKSERDKKGDGHIEEKKEGQLPSTTPSVQKPAPQRRHQIPPSPQTPQPSVQPTEQRQTHQLQPQPQVTSKVETDEHTFSGEIHGVTKPVDKK